jgi:hypothetical protein
MAAYRAIGGPFKVLSAPCVGSAPRASSNRTPSLQRDAVLLAWLFLLALIGMAPAVLTLDGPLTMGAELTVLAVATLIAAKALRPNEVAQLRILWQPLALWAAIPAILIAFQATPLPAALALSNPIWQSASTALGQPIVGSISVDTGSTLLSLCRYLAWLGVLLLAGAVAVDRQRAEWVLFATTAIAAATALLLIISDAMGLVWLDSQHDPVGHGGALAAAVLGIILSTACAVRAYERFETRKAHGGRPVHTLAFNMLLSVCAFALSAAAIALEDKGNTLLAAAVGCAISLGIVLARRLGLGRASGLAWALGGCALAVWIVAGTMRDGSSDFTVRFAAPMSRSSAITQRMLADGRWIGTGPGTFHALVPVYREPSDASSNLDPPTAAAEIAVEWGRPLLWAGAVAAVVLVGLMLRAGMSRGRDSFYAAAGASTVAALLIMAFGNPGVLGTSVLIIVATVLGLAVAQSRGGIIQ